MAPRKTKKAETEALPDAASDVPVEMKKSRGKRKVEPKTDANIAEDKSGNDVALQNQDDSPIPIKPKRGRKKAEGDENRAPVENEQKTTSARDKKATEEPAEPAKPKPNKKATKAAAAKKVEAEEVENKEKMEQGDDSEEIDTFPSESLTSKKPAADKGDGKAKKILKKEAVAEEGTSNTNSEDEAALLEKPAIAKASKAESKAKKVMKKKSVEEIDSASAKPEAKPKRNLRKKAETDSKAEDVPEEEEAVAKKAEAKTKRAPKKASADKPAESTEATAKATRGRKKKELTDVPAVKAKTTKKMAEKSAEDL